MSDEKDTSREASGTEQAAVAPRDEVATPAAVDATPEQAGPKRRRLSPRMRRWVLGGGIALALVLVFIVVPGYIALQPKFMQRYPRFSSEYQSWAASVHAEIPCQRCHVPPSALAQTAYKARMVGEFYLSLVAPNRQPPLFKPPTNAACRSCHLELRTVSPSGDLNIPHRAHVEVLKMDCITCHKYLVHTTNPQGTHTPAMATCLTCHNGVKAKDGCPTCHTNKDMPLNHRTSDWLVVHPQMQATMNCKACHGWTANWCAECHSHRPKSHGPNWRSAHGKAVATNRDCEACHQAAFCIRCHGQLPMLNYDPALKLVQ